MTNIEILKEAYNNCGYNVYFEDTDDNKLHVMVELRWNISDIYFSTTYDADVDLDDVIPSLKIDMSYTDTVSEEESRYVTYMMERYVKDAENNGTYACENIINTWNLELSWLNGAWIDFSNSLDKALIKARLKCANGHRGGRTIAN